MSFSAPSAAGNVVKGELPPELEFAFWGYNSAYPSSLVIALRVVDGPLDVSAWGESATSALDAGFDQSALADDADYAAMATGEYVTISWDMTGPPTAYADTVAGWGFDPRTFLSSTWQPRLHLNLADDVIYDHVASEMTATTVRGAIDELVAVTIPAIANSGYTVLHDLIVALDARITALENP